MATLITRLSNWRDEKTVLSIEVTEDSHPRTSTQINPKFESASIIYFSESEADVLAHKAEIDAGHTARKTVPLPKDTEDSSADEAIFPPSKRTRMRPSPGISDDDRSFDDMFAELSTSDSENDHDGQPMVSPIEAIVGSGDHSLRDANAVEVGQLRIELNEYKLKCQQLQKDVKNKEMEETRLKEEVKRISDLLYMDPAQQLAALVIHINGFLEELKTALADSRKHSQDLQQLLDRQQPSDSLPGNSGTRRVAAKQQYLVSGMSLMINEADLKLAVSYGSVGNGDSNMRSMINKIMESVYTREFMATHSYTGKKTPAKRQDKEHQPKPALPIDDVKAIRCKHVNFALKLLNIKNSFYSVRHFILVTKTQGDLTSKTNHNGNTRQTWHGA
ncbi:hypothetical protein GHT06_006255 [Daphnia sinensis]|uniref:BEN domain-containing protein n=1 Tax=Daphnia sinensis TaxID=1820382 RepID=A0AAD5PKQ9_9CRUS|nr:hypothetical protein GHT06_006255 [Daphnia sinensis]